MSKPVKEVVAEIVQEEYLGGIEGLAVLMVNREGEIEIKLGFKSEHAYKVITAMRVLEYNLLKDITENAATKPKERE